MTDFDTVYDAVNDEAFAHWQAERPDIDPGDQEPNDILDRAEDDWAVYRQQQRQATVQPPTTSELLAGLAAERDRAMRLEP